jgi:hypothetical protein
MKHFPQSPTPPASPPGASRGSLSLLAGSLVTFATLSLASAQIAAWDFTGESAVATSTAEIFGPNMDSSADITRGATAAASNAGNSFRTAGFQNNGIATTNTDYFQTTLSAAPGYTLSLSTIDARFAGTAGFFVSPGVTDQFAYSLDGTNFTLIGSPAIRTATGPMAQIALAAIPALQNLADTVTVTFRYYASGQTTTGGWGFNSPSAGTYGLTFGGAVISTGVVDTTPPVLQSLTPADNSLAVFPNANLIVTYDEPVQAGSGTIEIRRSADNVVVESITTPNAKVQTTGATATINPGVTLDYSTGYYVTLTSGTFKDFANNSAPAITLATDWNFTTSAGPSLVISQYYEGLSSSDRYVELKNLTGSPLSLTGYRLATWSDSVPSDNEGWKSGTETTDRVTSLDGFTIPPNGSFLITNVGATIPGYAANNFDLAVSDLGVTAFNGDDSIVLYSGTGFSQAEIMDAVSFSANQGADKSFYRINNLAGYDLVTGSSIVDYSSIWGVKTLAEVNTATTAEDWYLMASQAPKMLTLAIDVASFSEGAGTSAATATVTREGDTSAALEVITTVSDTSEASAQATVMIPIGESSITFPINAVNDLYLDGDQVVTITVSAPTFSPAAQQVTVLDEPTDVAYPVVINEVDSDQALTDTGEFIELYNNSNAPVSLDGTVLVLYNGSNDLSYRAIDLTGFTIPANSFFVVGNPGVASAAITFPDNTLQNGADAVALYVGSASSFPNNTPVSPAAAALVDAIVYGTGDPDDTGLLNALTPGKIQVDEGTGAAAEANAMARLPDGGAAFASSLFVAQAPSPGATNALAPPNTNANWIDGFFPDETDPLIIGFGADPDGDGIANGVEALIGGSPNAAGVFATTELTKTADGLTFLYPQAKIPPSGVTAGYEWSTDMANWQASGVSFGEVTVTLADVIWDDTLVAVNIYQVTAAVTAGTAPKLFVRVKAMQP